VLLRTYIDDGRKARWRREQPEAATEDRSAATLAAGHKAVRLRAAWAGASLIGVLVVATSVAASVGLHPQNRPMNAAALPSLAPQPSDTKPSWPLDGNGQPQDDATARSGARYQQGVKLFKLVTQSVPAGWTMPAGKTDSGDPKFHLS
jgi:hypothetical protein